MYREYIYIYIYIYRDDNHKALIFHHGCIIVAHTTRYSRVIYMYIWRCYL